VNAYDPVFGFAHDVRAPQVFFGYNDDDGLFVGGGMQITRHGFRRTPFARQQSLKANFAARTQAYNLLYEGHFTEALGPWALGLEAEIRSPNNIRNFYGLGNETDNTEAKREFYEARLRQTRVAPTLRREQPGSYAFYLGPTFEITRVREDASRFIPEPQPGLSPTTFDDQYLGGLAAGLVLEAVDHPANPRQGVRWNATGQFNVGLGNTTKGFSTLASDLTVYRSLSFSPQVTLAGRLGGAHNLGAFPFYEAVTLGGKENLRGYRSTRYAGRSSFYQSLELRAELFRFSTYLALGQAGLLGFLDNGRVWTDGERSTTWHQGYGGGLWLAFFDAFVLNTTVGFSEDDRTFTMKVGFLY
jgi:outer membrane protein assembly factor BamA